LAREKHAVAVVGRADMWLLGKEEEKKKKKKKKKEERISTDEDDHRMMGGLNSCELPLGKARGEASPDG